LHRILPPRGEGGQRPDEGLFVTAPRGERPATETTTIPFDCIPRSVPSPRPPSFKDSNWSSFRNVTANWRRLDCDARSPAHRVLPRQRLPDDCSQVTIPPRFGRTIRLRRGAPAALSQDRSPGGRPTARLPRLRDWHQGVRLVDTMP
jgi:hypothetical protein